jgi:hypothetical protein
MQILVLILQVIIALPRIIEGIQKIQKTIDDIKREKQIEKDRAAGDEMLETGDQRSLEEAIGSPNAGKPAIHRDGVQERPSRD